MRYSAKKENWNLSFKIPVNGLKNVQSKKPSRGLVLERIVLEKNRNIFSSGRKFSLFIGITVVLLTLLTALLSREFILKNIGFEPNLPPVTTIPSQGTSVMPSKLQATNEIYYQEQLQRILSKSSTNQEDLQQAHQYLSEWYDLMLKRQRQEEVAQAAVLEKSPEMTLDPSRVFSEPAATVPLLTENMHPAAPTPLPPVTPLTMLATLASGQPLSATDKLQSSTSIKPPSPKVTQLLQECAHFLKMKSLTSGKNGNALACYQQVLIQDPDNAAARIGLQTIEKQYLDWIEKAFKVNHLPKVQEYIKNLQKVNPNLPQLPILQQRLTTVDTKEPSSKDTVTQKLSTEKLTAIVSKSSPVKEKVNNVQQPVDVKAVLSQKEKSSSPKLPTDKSPEQNRDEAAVTKNSAAKEIDKKRQTVTVKETASASSKLPADKSPEQNHEEAAVTKNSATKEIDKKRQMVTVKETASASPKLPADKLPEQNREEAAITKNSAAKEKPVSNNAAKEQSGQCNEIFSQESLGIVPLTADQKEFQRLHCQ